MPALHVSKPQKRKVQGEVSDFWYVRVTRSDGKRTWRTTGTADHKKALEFRKNVFEELAHEEKRLGRRPLGACLDAWLESKEPRVVESTYRTIEHKVKQIRKHFGEETPVTKIAVGEIESFLRAYAAEKTQWVKNGRNAHTVNHLRTWLIQFFKFCQVRGWVKENPAAQVEKFKTEQKEPKLVTDEDIDRLLETVRNYYPEGYSLVFFASRTGLRKGTLLKLDLSDVDWERQEFHIPAKKMKARADFHVPVLDEAFQYLLELKEEVGSEGKIFSKIPPRRWTWLTCHAGVSGLKFHDLRRYFLQRCCRQGVPFDVAMRLGDWRDAKVVLKHYRAIGQDELKKGLKVAFE